MDIDKLGNGRREVHGHRVERQLTWKTWLIKGRGWDGGFKRKKSSCTFEEGTRCMLHVLSSSDLVSTHAVAA